MKPSIKPLLVRIYTLVVAASYKFSFQIGIRLVRYSRGGAKKQLAPISFKDNKVRADDSNLVDFNIVITTFSKRFFSDCIPLVKELRNSGVTQEIIIGVNGDFNSKYDRAIRSKFLHELAQFDGVSPVCFSTFRGLSVVWNRAILSGDGDVTVVLNDDLIVNPQTISATFQSLVEKARTSGICLLNMSWSHFAITTSVFDDIGYFDERLLGIGEEDPDMTFRFEAFYGFTPPTISADGLIHDSSFSFDSKVVSGKGKYSLFNWVFIERKYAFGSGQSSRMFDRPALLILKDLNLYPAEKWRRNLLSSLLLEERKTIEGQIERNL